MGKTIYLAYFSPTRNTYRTLAAMGEAMSEVLGGEVREIDLTCAEEVEPRRFGKDDFVIFGAPVYAGRIPAVARPRFEALQGAGTPCAVVVSYGNRHYDDALRELADLARECGFVVKGAAAVVGRHTYGEIQVTRPDEADLAQDAAFARELAELPGDAPEVTVPGAFPYKEGGAAGKFRPLTSAACVGCGLCARKCPVGAIADDFSTISDACLSCFRCIRICPAGAKHMDTEEYRTFAEMFTEKLAARRENEFFLAQAGAQPGA